MLYGRKLIFWQKIPFDPQFLCLLSDLNETLCSYPQYQDGVLHAKILTLGQGHSYLLKAFLSHNYAACPIWMKLGMVVSHIKIVCRFSICDLGSKVKVKLHSKINLCCQ